MLEVFEDFQQLQRFMPMKSGFWMETKMLIFLLGSNLFLPVLVCRL